MNKVTRARAAALLIALLAGMTTLAQAGTAGAPTEATLTLRTESGARKSYRLVVKSGALSLNGIPLSDNVLLFDRQTLALAFSVVNSAEPRTCSSGIYEHRVTRSGKSSVERGCLEETRFKSLFSAFRDLGER